MSRLESNRVCSILNTQTLNVIFPGVLRSLALSFLASGSYLHFGKFERILPASPGRPLDPVGVGRVLAAQVLAVQVGHVAAVVPPRAVVKRSAVVLRMVVVTVFGCELHAVMFQQRVA